MQSIEHVTMVHVYPRLLLRDPVSFLRWCLGVWGRFKPAMLWTTCLGPSRHSWVKIQKHWSRGCCSISNNWDALTKTTVPVSGSFLGMYSWEAGLISDMAGNWRWSKAKSGPWCHHEMSRANEGLRKLSQWIGRAATREKRGNKSLFMGGEAG